MSSFSAFILNLSKPGNILFTKMLFKWKWSLQLSITVTGRRDNSLVYELSLMAAVELHVNATYYAQTPALKSVYGKDQSVIACKLFSSSWTVSV